MKALNLLTGRRFLAFRCSLVAVLVATMVGAGCSSPKSERRLTASGLHYQLKELREPRPNRVHILRVDLARHAVRADAVLGADPDGTGPAEASLTDPRKLAHDPAVLAYVNTNPWRALPGTNGQKNHGWFEGQPVDILGLAVSDGHVRSPATDYAATVWLNARGRVTIGELPGVKSAVEAMTGFQPVVTNGTVSVGRNEVRHPRTAIGINQEGTILWLVVVDGRQAHYSEGMTLYELGETMRELGCWDAVNMDGGGSSIMGLRGAKGQLRIMNSPSDRLLGMVRVRPLPAILTIRKAPPH